MWHSWNHWWFFNRGGFSEAVVKAAAVVEDRINRDGSYFIGNAAI